MADYDDVVLLDSTTNKLTSLAVDYYTKDNLVTFNLKIFNDTLIDVPELKIATSTDFDGIGQIKIITGGSYSNITSDWVTTANFGTLLAGQVIDVSLTIFISGGSPLEGLQTMPLYISKG